MLKSIKETPVKQQVIVKCPSQPRDLLKSQKTEQPPCTQHSATALSASLGEVLCEGLPLPTHVCYFTEPAPFRNIYHSEKQNCLCAKLIHGVNGTGEEEGEMEGHRHHTSLIFFLDFLQRSNWSTPELQITVDLPAVQKKDSLLMCLKIRTGPQAELHSWNSHLLSHFLFKM